jgi:hypothetical protein
MNKTMPKKIKKPKAAIAFQAKIKDGPSFVGIGNLRVVIMQDDDSWFAQGLEIDYVAQGKTIEDVKKHFENGLEATVDEHLRIFGSIENLLKVAPQEIWNEMFLGGTTNKRYRYSQLTIHSFEESLKKSLPFDGIQYLKAVKQTLPVST